MQGSGEVGLRSGGATPTPLINKERGIKVGFICLRLHHPTLSSVVLPKHPTKRTQLQRIPQIWQRERLSLFRWTWRSSCIVPTFTAITASSPLFNQPSSHGTAVGQGPDLLAEEPLSHGTALGQGPDLTLPD